MADGEPQSGGGGVSRVARHTPARVGVLVGGDSRRPEGVIGAVRGVEKGVLVSPRRGAGGGAAFRLPVLGPQGEGPFPSDSLRMRRRLNPVKGGAWGEAASREGLEPCRVVRDPEPLWW